MSEPRRAAVFVPFAGPEGDGDARRIGFILRAEASSTHADDVGFPGGKPEPVDDSLRDTAHRETVEEVGLAPDDFDLVDRLAPHRTRSTGFEIHPFIGVVSAPRRFVPDSREVAETFWVSLPALRDAYEMDGDRIRYRVASGHEIWGVTARIVTSVLVADPDVGPA